MLEAVQQFAVAVLEAVRLVDDNAAPFDLAQLRAVGKDHLKGGDQSVEFVSAGDQTTLKDHPKISTGVAGTPLKTTVGFS